MSQSMDISRDPGDTLPGGYRIIDVLEGGMGRVYICHQAATSQFYAIKTVHFRGASDPEDRRKSFAREVRRWIALSQTDSTGHIVRALTYNADDGFLILEYINGLPLGALISDGVRLHPSHTLRWAKEIATAMSFLHQSASLIHRDLKPQNVLIKAEDLSANVTDFGIVTPADRLGPMTRIGTPAYMAPETADGRFDRRSDIYSFGVTLTRMLLGFYLPPEETNQDESKPILLIALKCREEDPQDRYASFDEILAELRTISVVRVLSDDEFRSCDRHGYFFLGQSCPFCSHAKELKSRLDQTLTASEVAHVNTLTLNTEAEPAVSKKRRVWPMFVAAGVVLMGILFLIKDGKDGPPNVAEATSKCTTAGCVNQAVPLESHARRASVLGIPVSWQPASCDLHSSFECQSCLRRYEEPVDVCASCNESMICNSPGCTNLRASRHEFDAYVEGLSDEDQKKIRDWVPKFCTEHNPVRCTRCGRRFSSEPDLPCACGEPIFERNL